MATTLKENTRRLLAITATRRRNAYDPLRKTTYFLAGIDDKAQRKRQRAERKRRRVYADRIREIWRTEENGHWLARLFHRAGH